jgi:O-antigen ligase
MGDEKWEVGESRSVRSSWIWRGFLVLALVALGIAILLGTGHHTTFAVLWLVIAAGWFAISMWLWRMHTRYMNEP